MTCTTAWPHNKPTPFRQSGQRVGRAPRRVSSSRRLLDALKQACDLREPLAISPAARVPQARRHHRSMPDQSLMTGACSPHSM